MKTKLSLLVLVVLVLMASCAAAEQEVVSSGDMTPELYFNSWEIAKNSTPPASGQFWYLGEHEYMVFATSEESFLHEGGHIVDAENDYPSQNENFQDAVSGYVYNPPADVQDELHHYLFVVVEQGLYDDAYAQLYMWDILYSIPQEFEEFYAR